MKSLNFILGFIVFIISLSCILMIYVKVKHKFWSNQPVFHIYSLRNWFFPKGIIDDKLPVPNKFCDFFFTKTIDMKILNQENIDKKIKYGKENKQPAYNNYNLSFFSPDLITHFVNFVAKNYLQTKIVSYSPNSENILPYFRNHNHPCYLTYYINQPNNMDTISGYITSRPLEMYLDGYNLLVYYVDYLCVDKIKRKKGIAPKLIQSHAYKQRHQNPSVDIMLFKRETKVNLLVPLVIYLSYGFDLHYWKLPRRLPPGTNMLSITPDNFYFCREILHTIAKSKFSCVIYPNMGNLLHLIKTKNIIMYSLLNKKQIIALYIFRDSCTTVNNNRIVDCIGSISNCANVNLFILGFHQCIFNLRKLNFSYINIENISNNDRIIENIITKYAPDSVSNMAYYFYNFANLPKMSQDVLIIS